MFNFLFSFLFILLITSNLKAEVVNKFNIQGNERIFRQTEEFKFSERKG